MEDDGRNGTIVTAENRICEHLDDVKRIFDESPKKVRNLVIGELANNH